MKELRKLFTWMMRKKKVKKGFIIAAITIVLSSTFLGYMAWADVEPVEMDEYVGDLVEEEIEEELTDIIIEDEPEAEPPQEIEEVEDDEPPVENDVVEETYAPQNYDDEDDEEVYEEIVAYQAVAPVGNLAELKSAIQGAPTNGEQKIIELTADISLTTTDNALAISAGANILIRSSEVGIQRTIHIPTSGEMTATAYRHFITSGGTGTSLTLEDVILNGGNANRGGIYFTNATFTLGTNAKITGIVTGTYTQQNMINMSNNAIFKMTGGEISNNKIGGDYSKGINLSSSNFILSEGIISGNTSVNVIPMINIDSMSSMTMAGGLIENNVNTNVNSTGGAIHVGFFANFSMTGGVIRGNEGQNGGAIYVGPAGNITITGGTIENNTARASGGAIYVATSEGQESGTIAIGNPQGGEGIIFRGNRASNAYRPPGELPNITSGGDWTLQSEEQSIFGHLLTNFDIGTDAPMNVESVTGLTVTYDLNEGESSDTHVISDLVPLSNHEVLSLADLEEYFTAEIPEAFVGWNTAADGSGTWYQPEATLVVNDDITLYAQWIMPTYHTVTFDLGEDGQFDGETGLLTQQVMEGQLATPLNPEPFILGYEFLGWFLENEEAPFDFETTQIEDNITLFARFDTEETLVSVTFFQDDIEHIINWPENQTDILWTDFADEPEEPIRVGYRFNHWYVGASNEAEGFDFGTRIRGHIILRASWASEENVTVTFDGNAGEDEVFDLPAPQEVAFNDLVNTEAVTEPIRVGYSFQGWATDEEGEILFDLSETRVTGDETLYAIWHNEELVNVTFNPDGGEPTPELQEVAFNDFAIEPEEAMDKTGHTFVGRFLAGEAEAWDFDTRRVTEDMVLIAVWEPNPYTVTFLGEDESELDVVTVLYGQTVPATSIPETLRSGYWFNGWFVVEEDTVTETEWMPDTPIAGNLIVQGVWLEAEIEVTFHPNGGTFSGQVPTDLDGNHLLDVVEGWSLEQVRPVNPTRLGHEFVGWTADGEEGSVIEDEAGFTISENVTFHAVWDGPFFVEVTFGPAGGTFMDEVEENVALVPSESRLVENVLKYATFADMTDVVPENPVRLGYQFVGWDNEGPFTEESTVVTAIWKGADGVTTEEEPNVDPMMVAVTFNPDGDFFTVEENDEAVELEVLYNSRFIDIPEGDRPVDPLKLGHDFDGWDNEGPFTEATIITAQWRDDDSEPFTVTVTFDADDGAFAGGETSHVEEDVLKWTHVSDIPTPDNPVQYGYVFLGWDWNGVEAGIENDRVTDDVTVSALWSEGEEITITFDVNGGSFTHTDDLTVDVIATTEVNLDELVRLGLVPENPARLGFDFGGWSLNHDNEAVVIAGDVLFEGNITLYAIWLGVDGAVNEDPIYVNLTFDPNYGAFDEELGLEENGNYILAVLKHSTLADFEDQVPSVSRDGYTFVRWDWGYGWTGDTPLIEDIFNIAIWEQLGAMEVDITYVLEESSETIEVIAVTIPAGEASVNHVVLSPYDNQLQFFNEGYAFVGWTDGEADYEIGQVVTITRDSEGVTFTGEWEAQLDVEVSFYADYGANEWLATLPVQFNAQVSEPELAPTRDGWEFQYWRVVEAGENAETGESWVAGAQWNFNQRITDDLILEAVWLEAQIHHVTFVLDGIVHGPFHVAAGQVIPENIVPPVDATDRGFLGWFVAGETEPWNLETRLMPAEDVVLYGRWAEEAVEDILVTFDPAGGTFEGESDGAAVERNVAPGTLLRDVPLPNLLEREGFNFVGWMVENAEQVLADYFPLTESVTLVAKWVEMQEPPADTFTVIFNPMTGQFLEMGIGELIVEKGVEAGTLLSDILPVDPTHPDGFTFEGWVLFGADTPLVAGDVEITEDMVLYAKWLGAPVEMLEITFDPSGGAFSGMAVDQPIVESEVPQGTLLGSIRPTDPTRDGFTFAGWAVADTNEVLANYFPLVESVTLVAKWVEMQEPPVDTFTVIFNPMTGQFPDMGVGELIVEKGVEAGTLLSDILPTDPVHPDEWAFGGWMLFDTDTPLAGNVEITGDMVLYAKWLEAPLETVAVTFDPSEGAFAGLGEGQSITKDDIPLGTLLGSVRPTDPMRDGFTFVGWMVASTDEVLANYFPLVESVTLVAKWVEVGEPPVPTFQVIFNPTTGAFPNMEAGGLIILDNVDYGTTLGNIRPIDPVRTGWNFVGWRLLGEESTVGDHVQVTGHMVLNAVWTEETLPPQEDVLVIFSPNGGFFETEDNVEAVQVTVPHGVSLAEIADVPENPLRLGYNFAEWNNTGPFTSPETTVSALWSEALPVTVTFNLDGGHIVQGEEAVTVPIWTHINNIATPTVERADYVFTGWYWDVQLPAIENGRVIGNVEVVATWESITLPPVEGREVQITYGRHLDEADTVTHQEIVIIPAGETSVTHVVLDPMDVFEPVEGYQFQGWLMDDEMVAVGTEISVTDDTTLLGVWEVMDDFQVVFQIHTDVEGIESVNIETTVRYNAVPVMPSDDDIQSLLDAQGWEDKVHYGDRGEARPDEVFFLNSHEATAWENDQGVDANVRLTSPAETQSIFQPLVQFFTGDSSEVVFNKELTIREYEVIFVDPTVNLFGALSQETTLVPHGSYLIQPALEHDDYRIDEEVEVYNGWWLNVIPDRTSAVDAVSGATDSMRQTYELLQVNTQVRQIAETPQLQEAFMAMALEPFFTDDQAYPEAARFMFASYELAEGEAFTPVVHDKTLTLSRLPVTAGDEPVETDEPTEQPVTGEPKPDGKAGADYQHPAGRRLPQTGDIATLLAVFIGLAVLGAAGLFMRKRIRR